MNLDQQLHAHQPQPCSGKDILEGGTSGTAPNPHLARSSSPDLLNGPSDLNLDMDDQSKIGSNQVSASHADVPDPGCQELNWNEPTGEEGDRDINHNEGIDWDEGIDQEEEVDRPINLEELLDLAHNEEIKTPMDFVHALEL